MTISSVKSQKSESQSIDSKTVSVRATSSPQTSGSDQSTVVVDTNDASSTQISGLDHSTGSPIIDSANDNIASSAKINDSNTSNANKPDKITDSGTNDMPNLDAKNGHQMDEVEKPSSFECKKVGRFPHPSSCTKYHYCWDINSWSSEFTCTEYRAFDPVTQQCVVNYGVCALVPKCNNDKQIIPNPDDKWSFFVCKINEFESNEIELLRIPCANYREYDEKLGYCKLTSVIGDMVLDSDEKLDSNVACDETGLFIDYEDDTKYFECVVKSVSKGILKPIHHKCPTYHVFSMLDKKCVPLSTLSKFNPTQTTNGTNVN